MARKLKTYTTSAGFFDLAVAAPSMKAALQAWGSTNDLFQQGFAKVSDDPAIVAATLARPGVILRRPVGSNGTFTEHAELPDVQDISRGTRAPAKRQARTSRQAAPPVDEGAARAAALAFEREEKQRERQSRREEAARHKERERRDRAVASAEAALEEGKQAHEANIGKIGKARAALDRKLDAEEARWKKKREQLESALRRARSPAHLRLV